MRSLFGRVLALVLLIGVCAGAYVTVVAPLWSDYWSSRQSRLQSAEILARYQRLGGSLEALETRLAALLDAQASQGGYLSGESNALAAATLQNHVNGVVGSTGEKIRSIQVLPVQEKTGFMRIAIRVQVPIRIGGLRRVLHALEGGLPLVFIDNLDIRRRKVGQRWFKENEDVYMDVRFDVIGYMRVKES